MKKFFTFFTALALLCAVGCEEQGDDNVNPNDKPNTEQPEEKPDDAYISLNKDILTFSPDGESVEVKVYSNYEWTLTNNCDWVTTSVTGGEASDAGTTVTLTADLTYDDREGTITFSCGKAKKLLVVSQSLKEVIIADENNTFSVPAEGGNVIINYQTSVECEVIIPEEAKSWISLAPATRALVSESATLTVAENTTYSERSAVVKVVKVGDNTLFAEYTINQVQNDAIIADENNTFNLNGLAQSINIAYQTNVECEVVIPEEAKSWISLAPATRALVNESATLNIAENNTGAERSVVVKVVAANNKELVAEYTITQAQRYYIEYTSTHGYTITPYRSGVFGATIIRNKYIDGKGYIDFDAPVTSIGRDAFSGCTSLTSITIPDSVTSIGDLAFYGCSSLTSVTIGNGVTSIGSEAFSGCTSLESVTIGDSVTSIGGGAFKDCSSLRSITIGNGVTEIGREAFYNCKSLTSVTIGNGVTSIGEDAFYDCIWVERVDITDIVAWCGISFYNGFSNPLVYADNLYLNGVLVTELIIPDSVTTIGDYAFYWFDSLTSVTIPDSVTSIGKYAFQDCDSLTSATIGNGVTTIGEGAFNKCDSLTSVTIPDSVTSIGVGAFANCESLTSITIPDSVTTIGDYAFYYCPSLTSVIIGNGVTSIGSEAFENCRSLKSVTIPDSVTLIGEKAFYYCDSLTSVYITDIAAWCNISFGTSSSNPLSYAGNLYLNNELVTDLIIPDGATKIGSYAFHKCTSLTSVTIPDSVTSIGKYAFYDCTSLTSATIGNGVTEIGEGAFNKCTSLTSVTIPDSVTSIGSSAFYECSSLTSVTIPDSVTSIGERAFYDCASLTSVTIGNSVTSIGKSAFNQCASLTSVTIGNGVTTIGEEAFLGCHSLTSVTIPDSVTSIGKYAFQKCTSLTSVTLPDSVTSIGNSAFYKCTSLASVTIPNSVTSIGENAFSYCRSLTSVYCKPTTPPAGGSGMFDNNASGRKIYVPRASVDAYKSASGWSSYASYIVEYDF